ncbi:MAG: DUF134 domain-containing protein [Candidatus Aenigmatarchaeota archaeon]
MIEMPRPRIPRSVRNEPNVTYFKPAGIMMKQLEQVILTVDEFEALRLKDYESVEQTKSAEKMNISQPTFQRLLLSARRKIADAIVNGKAIKIEGGDYKISRRGDSMKGRGRMSGFAAGPSGNCICTKCGHKVPHQKGMPCYQMKCPKCGGAEMTRG